MGKIVIKVGEISKRYRLGLKELQAETLVGQFTNLIKSPWQNLRRLREMSKFAVEDESVFWALRDINFEVKEGEVLGIIGKNGAGKSTLLKILSGITDPTSGRIEIHGRIASLLEVGTGFHPELSGRENIYMNGTILGMTRKEIDSKLDEIIDFSGVEKFIDTAVKFYSSGMKVRLGFSVAAHLEPEILIIDEVLAVGDAEFQKKCIKKMDQVSKHFGRSILFVSHNLQSLSELCSSGLVLDKGKIIFQSDIETCIRSYNKTFTIDRVYKIPDKELEKSVNPIITSIKVEQNPREFGSFDFIVQYRSSFIIKAPIIGIVISDEFGREICGFNNRFYKSKLVSTVEDRIIVSVDRLYLHSGRYAVSVFLGDSLIDYCSLNDIISFIVKNDNVDLLLTPSIKNIGSIYVPEVRWDSI